MERRKEGTNKRCLEGLTIARAYRPLGCDWDKPRYPGGINKLMEEGRAGVFERGVAYAEGCAEG